MQKTDINNTELSEISDQEVIPSMNVNLTQPEEAPNLISDENLLNTYDTIDNDLNINTVEVSELIDEFKDMVINQGDASNSTKECLVALMKIKTDIADKKIKIADLKTRVKLKERDTFPRYLAANQTNHVTIEKIDRRSLLENIHDEINNSKKGN